MLALEKGRVVFHSKQCCQCGACVASCQERAIEAVLDKDGLWVMHVSSIRCKRCGRCVSVCPGRELPLLQLEESVWGFLKKANLAWHREPSIRNRSSSGGAARALLEGCLTEKKCDAVYTLMKTNQYPWAEGRIIRGRFDAEKAATSMYLPVLALQHLRPDRSVKTMAIVGTTCQLLAASKLLRGRVEKLVRIALLCKQQKHLGFIRFIGRRLGYGTLKKIDSVSFRGNGWPGTMMVNKRALSWEQSAAIPFGKALWRVPGCLSCVNPFGFQPDITLADPWGLDGRSAFGNTLVMAWTDTGMMLLANSPSLQVGPGVSVEAVQASIGWSALLRRQALIRGSLGMESSVAVHLVRRLAGLERAILEKILESVKLPDFVYRLLAHLPDPMQLIPDSAKNRGVSKGAGFNDNSNFFMKEV